MSDAEEINRVNELEYVGRRFSPELARIIVHRVAECGSYWRACESLGIGPGTASRWWKQGGAGREPHASFRRQVEAAKASRLLAELGLTADEEALYRGDPEAIERYRDRLERHERAARFLDGKAPVPDQ